MTNKISATEAQTITRQINRMDLDTADYTQIKDLINRLTSGITTNCIVLNPDTQLYRGIRYKNKPAKTTQLGHPPTEIITDYQRCNPPAKPMFYCSADIRTALYELDAQVNERIYVSNWSACKKFFINQIVSPATGDTEEDLVRAIIFIFIETIFSRPVHATYSSQYKITSAIAET